MSRRPKRSRAEQRTPTVIQAVDLVSVDVVPEDQAIGGGKIDRPRDALDQFLDPFDPLGLASLNVPKEGSVPGAPFDEELPALPAAALATATAQSAPLPTWWPEDASQQATLVEALDSWDLGYNEVGGIAFREQLVVVTVGGLKLHWPADRGRVISDMHKGRPHAHTGPGRQFPGGYLRRDASRDPKE